MKAQSSLRNCCDDTMKAAWLIICLAIPERGTAEASLIVMAFQQRLKSRLSGSTQGKDGKTSESHSKLLPI